MGYIELDQITFSYETGDVPVLQGLSLQMDRGESLIVMGDNGAGKTTLFRILNGLSFPQQGSYLFDGEEITKKKLHDNEFSKKFHKRIGYLFQNPDVMLFNATVFDEIAFGPRQMGIADREVEQRVLDCMELFSISELQGKAPYHLSMGQKKKVAFASVLSLNPEVLILDEPFAGLDRKTTEWVLAFLGEWRKSGKTLIMATHGEQEAARLADRVLTIG